MTLVKICGITNLEDAQLAAELGADMLGFNFYSRSARCVSQNLAATIVRAVPKNVKKVGVFVNASIEDILDICSSVDLDAIQLHGDETVEFEADLRKRSNLETIKAVRIGKEFDANDLVGYESTILLDAYRKGEYGGTGETFDWQVAKEVSGLVELLILAGGLTSENVAEAARTVGPYAVDVASGVESSPGKKDPKKMEAFVKNAKNA